MYRPSVLLFRRVFSVALFTVTFVSIGCAKKGPGEETPEKASAAKQTEAAPTTASNGLVWPSKQPGDVLVGSVNDLSKNGQCSTLVLTAKELQDKPKARDNLIDVFKSNANFAEAKGCPDSPHIAGMCYIKQISGYIVFYTENGGKKWSADAAKAECASAAGKWKE